MTRRRTRLIGVAAILLALPGCNSIFGKTFASRNAPISEPAPLAVAPATDAGRGHLAAGRDGLAIEAFQVAVSSGEPAAPAFNGLAVAYAHLGRYDLSQRYFERAIVLDGDDPRYQGNLARLMGSPAFAMRREGDMGRALAAANPPAAAAPVQQPLAAPVQGKLQRTARGQVFIATAQPMNAPTRTAIVRLDARFKPLIRDALPTEDSQPADEDSAKAELEPAKTEPKLINFRPLLRDTLPPLSN